MKLIEFPEQTIVIAKNQPEYMPLPAFVDKDPDYNASRITCCWQLTFKERLKLLFTGLIWHSVLTFNSSLQPQLLQVNKPDYIKPVNS